MLCGAMNGKRKFSKHYTSSNDSLRIYNNIKMHLAKGSVAVCDPCAGAMSLLIPFLGHPNVRKITAADIYPDNRLKGVQSIKTNSLMGLASLFGKIDIVVTNPPFGRVGHPRLQAETQENIEEHLKKLSETIGLSLGKRIHNLELAFLSLCTELLRNEGVCAIVLPESVFSCSSYEGFRLHFQKSFEILRIEQLSETAFSESNANVNTGVLYFRKRRVLRSYQYQVIDNSGLSHISNTTHANWYPWKNIKAVNPPKNLKSLKWSSLAEILPNLKIKSGYKGSQPKTLNKLISEPSAFYVTSRHINEGILEVNSEYVVLTETLKRTIARPGDILLVRSGMGCVGRVAEVPVGLKLPVVPRSEIYVITNFKNTFERRQFLVSIALASLANGRPWWIAQLASGVGTPNLNKREISHIPLVKVSSESELRRLEALVEKHQVSTQLVLIGVA